MYPIDANPYQHLLYAAVARVAPTLHIFTAAFPYRGRLRHLRALPFIPMACYLRLRGARILHLHWPDFGVPAWIPCASTLSSAHLRLSLRVARLCGYKLVWTVHNILPHSQQTADDLRNMRFLAESAHVKILHSLHTRDQMLALGMNVASTVVIPHGSYIDAYPPLPSVREARRALGLDTESFVFLCLGNLRAYKGVSALLAAFAHISDEGAVLLIAGQTQDDATRDALRRVSDPRVVVHDGFVPAARVPLYYGASDIVCAPFTTVTTSGSVLLALGYGRAVITVRQGALRDLPDDAALFCDGDTESLGSAMRHALSDRTAVRVAGQAASAYAASLPSWSAIAEQTRDAYELSMRWRAPDVPAPPTSAADSHSWTRTPH
ncbi:MAG: glycosyltransferase family 4 protein [Solirubrobacteraceae bacterium]